MLIIDPPLQAFLVVHGVPQEGRSHDAEREEEAHGEAEEDGGGHQEGQNHGVVVGRPTLNLGPLL